MCGTSNPVFFPDTAFSKQLFLQLYNTEKSERWHKIFKVVAISSVMAKHTKATFLYNIGFNNSWLLVCCSNGFSNSVSLPRNWIPGTSGIEDDSSSVSWVPRII